LKSQILRVLHEPGLSESLKIRGKQQAGKYTWSQVAQTILSSIGSVA
jgi:hypothetical protein